MLKRAEWGMPGPLGVKLGSSRGVWLHHSVTRATSDPVADARRIAQIGIQRFGRMSYSWVVHPDGTILEGQAGHLGVHTRGQNSTSQAICCVGNFENDPVTDEMVRSIRILVGEFGPMLGGHRDAPGAATACPGRNLVARMPELRIPLIVQPEPVEPPAPPAPEPKAPDPKPVRVAEPDAPLPPSIMLRGGTALPDLPSGLRWGMGGLPFPVWLRRRAERDEKP